MSTVFETALKIWADISVGCMILGAVILLIALILQGRRENDDWLVDKLFGVGFMFLTVGGGGLFLLAVALITLTLLSWIVYRAG